MNNIGLENYQSDVAGFNPNENVDALIKAMQAGNITGRDTADTALTQEPLKVESLDTTLKLLEFRLSDIALFNKMPKATAYNTVEEFLQLESYGADRGGFYNEGELSDVEDSTYIRRAELVKYIQVTGEVTIQAQMVRSYIQAMKQEVENKMSWVLRKANLSLTRGNSDVIPQEWNSLYRQHAPIGSGVGDYADLEAYFSSPQVIDLRGASLTQEDIEDGAIRVDNAFGTATDIWGPNQVISDFGKSYYEKQRILLGAGAPGLTASGTPKVVSTTVGDIDLSRDKFMAKSLPLKLTDPAQSVKAPVAIVPGGTPVVLTGADAQSKFVAADAGTVYYAVAAINRSGRSAITLMSATAVTLTTGLSVSLSFTPGVGANAATGFVIYRSKVTASVAPSADGVLFYPLFEISTAQRTSGYDGGAAGIVRDRNRILPDTEEAFITQMDEQVLMFKQLAPISKLNLATLSMANRFIVFMFGTPQLYAKKKMVKFINIGKYVAA